MTKEEVYGWLKKRVNDGKRRREVVRRRRLRSEMLFSQRKVRGRRGCIVISFF